MAGNEAQATLRIKTVMDSSDVISNVGQLQKRLQGLSLPKNLTAKAFKQMEELKDLTADYQNLISKPPKTKSDFIKVDQLREKIHSVGMELEKTLRGIDVGEIGTDNIHTEKLDKMRKELDDVKASYRELLHSNNIFKTMFSGSGKAIGDLGKLEGAIKNVSSQKDKLKEVKIAIDTGDFAKAESLLKEMYSYIDGSRMKQGNKDAAKEAINSVLSSVGKLKKEFTETNSEAVEMVNTIKRLESGIGNEVSAEITRVATGMKKVSEYTRQSNSAMDAYNNSVANSAKHQSEMSEQVQNLQNQVKNYFGLDEIFRKIGDLARDAMETVKELDAAMTETAVVTNFSVGDMWDRLPEYTANANALGSTIADVYNAATLYYQQGLNTNQAMDLANETLKMARIGGIEAAEATDMMTAALRGFNMELNQTSAQNINDVYSKLAAITAADTKEIGSAMERTASIANSANMDFETTSAFLAQMIETTREAPENLGTAMKSIVARFQELKEDPNTLVDSEGQSLEFNRVDKALRTVGVSLTDTNGQFRDLDDVFIEISSKWNGLSQAQQRYIATIAAGSRQQSRFIAMMQDYDRTIELVDAAYSAEGAGQAQFEKTLESMSSKLNKLKNAWDQFVMGLMNSDFLKFAVDAGTKILTIIEKLINGISKIGVIDPFQGLIKSALTATATFVGMVGASKLLMASIGKFAEITIGKGAAKGSSGIVGTAANYVAGSPEKQEEAERRKEERKRIASINKQRTNALRTEFYATSQSTNGGFIKSMLAGRNAEKELSGFFKGTKSIKFDNFGNMFAHLGKDMQTELQKSGINKSLGKAFWTAAKDANLDDSSRAMAQKFAVGIARDLRKNKITVEQAMQKMTEEADSGKYKDKTGKAVSLDLTSTSIQLPKQTSGLQNASMAFDKIGMSAQRAGIGIQQFAMSMYGTPLQPFGMALNLVSSGLMLLGQSTSIVSGAMKAFQGAMILGNAATSLNTSSIVANEAARIAQAEGISIFTAAQKLATLGSTEGAAAAYAESLGLDAVGVAGFEAAAGEAAAAAGSKGVVGGIRAITGAALSSPLMPFVVALLGIAAVGTILYKIATKDAKALEAQGDAAAQASQDLDTAKQALEAVNNDLEELANNDTALDGLITGTAEWNVKLAEANAHIIEMMGNYKALNEIDTDTGEYKYVQTDADGRMSITKEGQDAIKKQYQDAVNLATANNAIQGAKYNNLQDLNSKEYKENAALAKKAERANEKRGRQGGVNFVSDEEKEEAKRAELEKENIEKQNTAREENAWKVGMHSLLSNTTLRNSEATEAVLAKQSEQLTKEASENLKGLSKKEQKQRYAELSGYQYLGGNDYKDAQGNKITVDFESIKEELPELEALSIGREKASKADAALIAAQEKLKTGKGTTFDTEEEIEGSSNLIADIMAKSENTDFDALKAFMQKNKEGKTGIESYIEQFSKEYDKQDAEILKYLTGEKVTKKNYSDVLKAYEEDLTTDAEELSKRQEEAIAGAAGVLESSGWSDDQFDISNILDKMSSAQINMLSNTAESLSDNLSDKSAETYAKTVASLVNKGDTAGADELQGIMSKADFSSSLSTIEAYNQAADSANEKVKTFGENWEKTSESTLKTAGALQEVYSSDDFTDLSADMADYIKENDKLDGTKILQMAEDSQTLKRYLDATGASAEGVARAFTAIAKGDLQLSDLTPGIVAAVNAMDKLANSAGRAKTAISELEMSFDSGSYEDFLSGQKDTLEEMIENGEYGNEGLEEVLKNAFGAKAWNEAYAKGESGIKDLYDKFSGLLDKNVSDLYKEGDTTEDLLKKIQKEYDVTSEYADIMLQAATNTDIALKKKLEASNPKEMRQAYFETVGIKDENGKKLNNGEAGFGSKAEVTAQAMLYAPDDVDKQRRYIKNFAKDLGVLGKEIETESGKTITLKDALDEAKNAEEMGNLVAQASDRISNFTAESSGEEVDKELQKDWEARGFKGEWWKRDTEDESGGYDLQKITNKALGYGATDQQASEIAYEAAQASIENGERVTIGGQELTAEDVTDYNTFLTRQQELLDEAKWVTIGDTLGERIVAAWTQAQEIKDNKGEATESTNKWNKAGQINEKSNLFEWLTTTGVGQMVTSKFDKMDENNSQKENRKLVADTITEIAKSGVKMAQSTREGMWANMIEKTGGEGLAYGKTGDAGKIKENSEAYSEKLGADLFKDGGGLTDSINGLVKQMNTDELNTTTQSKMMNQYLSQFQQQYQDLDPKAQAQAIDNLTQKLSSEGFSADAIARAIESLSGGTEKEGKTFEMGDQNGQVSVDLKPDSPLIKELNGLEGTANIVVGNLTYKGKQLASGQNNPDSAFHRTGTMARGSRNHGYTIPGQPTLTGEEGPEVVWEPKKNTAYIVGEHGPQFANISKDATVWNARQTQQIKKNSKGARHLGTNAKGMRQVGTFAKPAPSSGGGIGQIDISATANIVSVQPDPLPIDAKPNLVVDEGKGGIAGFFSKLFGGDKKAQTVHLKGEVKQKDLQLPKNAKIKLGIKVTGKEDVATATSEINKLKQASGSKVKVNVKSSGGVNEGAISSSIANAGQDGSAKLQKSLESAGKQASFSGVSSGIASAGRTGAASVKSSLSGISATASITPKLTKSSLSVKGNKGGSATVSLYWSGAQGFNNYKLGSYAKGKRRNQSGAALTGEEGPEMAWYPSQQKAELLGVGGPQFVNSLPKDAVVWTAQQTEEIMKRKGQKVSSFASGKSSRSSTPYAKAAKNVVKFDKAIKGVSVKLFNYEKKLDGVNRGLDRLKDTIDESLKSIKYSSGSIKKNLGEQAKSLSRSIALNKKIAKINKKNLTTGSFEAKYTPKGSKKEKPVTIKNKKAVVYDPTTDSFLVNQKYINKIKKKKGKEAAKAAKEAIQGRIDDKGGAYFSAVSDQREAKKQLKEIRDQLKETLYAWETELTKVKRIQDKISLRSSLTDVLKSAQDALKLFAGDGEEMVGLYNNVLLKSLASIKKQASEAIKLQDESIKKYENDLFGTDIHAELKEAKKERNKYKKGTGDYTLADARVAAAQEKVDTFNLARKYIGVTVDANTGTREVTFNEKEFKNQRDKGNISDTQAKAIEEYYSKLMEDIQSIDEATKSIYDTMASYKQAILDQYNRMDSIANTLSSNMQEDEQEQIDKLETLNNSIRDGFSDLIDSVRNELEKQRRAEENKKTEKDISNQMNRLAMLRADTSGSNAAEIAQLEKEIEEATGNYEDSLEDQLLDRLQNQADEAAKQRERQIELLKSELDYSKSLGQYMKDAENLMIAIMGKKATAEQEERFLNLYAGAGKDTHSKWWSYGSNNEANQALLDVKNFDTTIRSYQSAIAANTEALEKLTKIYELKNSESASGILDNFKNKKITAKEAYKQLKNGQFGFSNEEIFKKLYNNGKGASIAQLKDLGMTQEQAIKLAGRTKKVADVYGSDVYAGKKIKNKENITKPNQSIERSAGSANNANNHITTRKYTVDKTGKNAYAVTGTKIFERKVNDDGTLGKSTGYKSAGGIDKEYAKKHPKESGQALLYKISKNGPGALINKNWKNLVGVASGIKKGKEITYKGGKGSIGSDGRIYYNNKNGVSAWNPGKKKNNITKIDTYSAKGKKNKTYFTKKAKKNDEISREYAQFLIEKGIHTKAWLKKKGVKKFLSGGLADYTGPAWLDGSTSKPELVLNATDTKNFLALKEALSNASRGVSNDYSKNIGDTNIEVNINVDSINSDYDVDKIAERVKKNIVQDARNRNVNIVTRRR